MWVKSYVRLPESILPERWQGSLLGECVQCSLINGLNLWVASNKNWQIYILSSSQAVTKEYIQPKAFQNSWARIPKSLWRLYKVMIRKKSCDPLLSDALNHVKSHFVCLFVFHWPPAVCHEAHASHMNTPFHQNKIGKCGRSLWNSWKSIAAPLQQFEEEIICCFEDLNSRANPQFLQCGLF